MAKVLFSTLGMTDPIKNDFDGPFLHILRHYQPKKAYLFMTKRVCELADQDDRYRVQAKQLCETNNFSCEIHEFRYNEIDNPQEFDQFYPIFEGIMLKIHDENPDDEVLINLSSGTPQMKSTCHLLALTAPYPVIPIQVTTPQERENYGSPDYDLNTSWRNNLDNHNELCPNNRSVIVKSTNMRFMFLREAAISNIESYNYTAAVNILKSVKEFVATDVMHLLYAAQHRKNMDLSNAQKESKLADYDIFPIKAGDAQKLFEYLLLLNLQQQSGQLMDFVRGISPALTKLFVTFLREQCRINVINDFCESSGKDPDYFRIKRYRVQQNNPDLLRFLDVSFKSEFKDSDLSCAALLPFIEKHCGSLGNFKNETAVSRARGMRMVEEKLRNPAAHNIIAMSEDRFQKVAGISSQKLLDNMKWMFKLCYPQYFKHDEPIWNSYEIMNEYIIHRLKSGKDS